MDTQSEEPTLVKQYLLVMVQHKNDHVYYFYADGTYQCRSWYERYNGVESVLYFNWRLTNSSEVEFKPNDEYSFQGWGHFIGIDGEALATELAIWKMINE